MTTPVTRISFLDPWGSTVEAGLALSHDDEPPVRPPLSASRALLSLQGQERTVRVVHVGDRGHDGRTDAYACLDNEILAGLRIARLYAGGSRPVEVGGLLGYNVEAEDPFALLEPLRGEPVGFQAGRMLASDRGPFQKSLLRAVLILGGAGIAHRNISPDTVRWDSASQTVQLADFSCAAPLGARRTVIGTPPWQPPEQQPRYVQGRVSERDDLWAVGKLVYYVLTGDVFTGSDQLDDRLPQPFRRVFTHPDQRPSARELLRELGSSPSVLSLTPDGDFVRGRAVFFEQRLRKHPQLEKPPAPEPPPVEADPPPPAEPERKSRSSRWVPALMAVLAVAAFFLFLINRG